MANKATKHPSGGGGAATKHPSGGGGAATKHPSGGGGAAAASVEAPDGGYGWVVVACCFMTTVCTRAITRCISIFFVEFQYQFAKDYSTTAWIHSIVDSMTMLCAPLGSFIGNRLSHRAAVMLGGCLSSTGLIMSSFATSLEFLYLSLGIVTGLGFALSYTPAVAMVGMHFSRRKALAYGLAMSGSGIGTFVLAPVVQELIELYTWRGALLILGGLVSHLCVCGALLKPAEGLAGERTGEGVEEDDDDDIKKEKGQLVISADYEQGDVPLKHDEPSDLKKQLANEKPSGEMLKGCGETAGDEGEEEENEKPHKEKCAADGVDEADEDDKTCYLPTYEETIQGSDPQPADIYPGSGEPSDDTQADTAYVIDETFDSMSTASVHSETNQVEDEKTTCTDSETPTQSLQCANDEHCKSADLTSQTLPLSAPKHADVHQPDSKLQDTKAAETKPLDKAWVSPAVPVGNERTKKCGATATDAGRGSCLRRCLPPTEEYGFLLMTDFLLLSVSFLFLAYGCSVPFVYLVPYALSMGVGHQQAALLISIMGVISIVGNVTFGWMTDLNCLRPYRMVSYMLAVGLEGFSCFLVPLLQSFPLLVPFSLLYGYFDGAYVALIPVVTSDIVGPTYLSSALGVVYFLHAIPYLISPPIGGWLVDHTGSYMAAFVLSGFSIMTSSVVLGVVCLLRHCCRGGSSHLQPPGQVDFLKPAKPQHPSSPSII